MNNSEQSYIRATEGEKEWEHLNATRLVLDAYADKGEITDPEAKTEWWEKNMLPELKRLGLSETATVADYVQAGTQDVERRMKDLKQGQL